MATIERAIALAAKAHEGQVDKAGAPCILHPLRVMLRVKTTEGRIVAVPGEAAPTSKDHERIGKYKRAIAQLKSL